MAELDDGDGVGPTLVLAGGDVSGPLAARRFVAAHLGSAGVPSSIARDLQLAVGELVTNAVLYGLPTPIVVTVHSVRDQAWVRVANESAPERTVADPEHWSLPDLQSQSGRGLAIVKAISDSVSLVRSGRQVVITAEFRLGDGR